MNQLKRRAFESGTSFKDTVNTVIRLGLRYKENLKSVNEKYICPEYAMGVPSSIDLNKALIVAETLENEEIVRKMKMRK